jgi:hypothetical protein
MPVAVEAGAAARSEVREVEAPFVEDVDAPETPVLAASDGGAVNGFELSGVGVDPRSFQDR